MPSLCALAEGQDFDRANKASARNGVGYGRWAHIDGWSEAVVEYIRELERSAD